ncbi:MAG: relaxase/mobilization nuclease domain-containing protein [Leptolyngbya sp. Prado105]|jgi:hypothetical protein|nr:relaxase/mobilization nuclease domain-containing protein [Leptolyngbya sp. Prado105]
MPLVIHAKPRNVYKAVDYALNKPGSICVGGTIISESSAEVARELLLAQPLNRAVERHIYHGKMSVEKGRTLSDELWEVVTQDFRDGMGYDEHPFILPRHTDQDHDHVHPIWGRTNEEGVCVRDSWDYYKAQSVLRDIEERYGLPKLQFSWETAESAPSFAEVHRSEQQQAEYEQGIRDRPPDISVRQRLLSAIQVSASDQPSMPRFIECLQSQGIEVKVYFDRTPRGISFQLNEIKFAGSSLGRGYSFPGLQNYFQISYEPERDDTHIHQLIESPMSVQPQLALELDSIGEDSSSQASPTGDRWQKIQQIVQPPYSDHDLIHQLYHSQVLSSDKKKRLSLEERAFDDQEEQLKLPELTDEQEQQWQWAEAMFPSALALMERQSEVKEWSNLMSPVQTRIHSPHYIGEWNHETQELTYTRSKDGQNLFVARKEGENQWALVGQPENITHNDIDYHRAIDPQCQQQVQRSSPIYETNKALDQELEL